MKGRFLSFVTFLLLMLFFVPFMISATADSPEISKIMEAGFLPTEIVLTPETGSQATVFDCIRDADNQAVVNVMSVLYIINSDVSIVKLENENSFMNVTLSDQLKYKKADRSHIRRVTAEFKGIFVSRIYGSYYFRSYV